MRGCRFSLPEILLLVLISLIAKCDSNSLAEDVFCSESGYYKYNNVEKVWWKLTSNYLLNMSSPAELEKISSCENKLTSRLLEKAGSNHNDTPAKLRFPTVVKPEISVVIAYYKNRMATYFALESVLKTTSSKISYEIILVDDCSPEENEFPWKLEEIVENIIYYRNPTNLGFLLSMNTGFSYATGEYIAILNNDIIVDELWLETLLKTFTDFENVGLVGSKMVSPQGLLGEACSIVFSDGTPWNVGKREDEGSPLYNFVREVEYCSAAAVLVDRSALSMLGGFDEVYVPAYYEDTDLCFGLRKLGKRILYQPFASVTHYESLSYGGDEGAVSTEKSKLMSRNKNVFLSKWEKDFPKLHSPGTPIQIAKVHPRESGKRILIIEVAFMTPDQDSGSLRLLYMMQLMLRLGHHVGYFNVDFTDHPMWRPNLQRMGVEVFYWPHFYTIAQIANLVTDFDIIIIARPQGMDAYFSGFKAGCPNSFIVYDTVDLHFLREERLKALMSDRVENELMLTSPGEVTFSEDIRNKELDYIRKADLSIVVSDYEKKLLQELVPTARIEILSNVHEIIPTSLPHENRSGVLFIGNMNHLPNQDAVSWYISSIHPLVRARLPHTKFYIVGSPVNNIPTWIRNNAELLGVEVLGYVADPRPLFNQVICSVAPLRFGAGVKGKIGQSLGLGVPVVTTVTGAEGMFLTEKEVLISSSEELFAENIAKLHTDGTAWSSYRASGIESVRENLSITSARKSLERIVEASIGYQTCRVPHMKDRHSDLIDHPGGVEIVEEVHFEIEEEKLAAKTAKEEQLRNEQKAVGGEIAPNLPEIRTEVDRSLNEIKEKSITQGALKKYPQPSSQKDGDMKLGLADKIDDLVRAMFEEALVEKARAGHEGREFRELNSRLRGKSQVGLGRQRLHKKLAEWKKKLSDRKS